MAEPLRPNGTSEPIPSELAELYEHLQALPRALRDRMLPLCERVCQFAGLQSRLLRIAQEAVDQLQLDVKYLVFDLEATRRERDTLRQELENL